MLTPPPPAMLTTFLYLFTFSSWGVGLLAALTALSMKLQEHSIRMKGLALEAESDALELVGKRAFIDRISEGKGKSGLPLIPEELKRLIEQSPDHPEVSEIDGEDQLMGVLFKAEHYPPAMETDDD